MEQSRKKEREKKRKALLELQYADMVSNLVLLLGAGMTVSKAWNRLTENYMNERQKRTICRKEVYEEMQRTSFEIKMEWGKNVLMSVLEKDVAATATANLAIFWRRI